MPSPDTSRDTSQDDQIRPIPEVPDVQSSRPGQPAPLPPLNTSGLLGNNPNDFPVLQSPRRVFLRKQNSETRSQSEASQSGGSHSGASQSATSQSSVGSYIAKSVSSSSLLYYMKKLPIASELPFMDPIQDPAAINEFMDLVKQRSESIQRKPYHQLAFRLGLFTFMLCVIYFAFIGMPLWDGIVYSLWKFCHTRSHISFGYLLFLLWGVSLAWLPLIGCTFDKNVDTQDQDTSDICVVIPAYKAAQVLPSTIDHALKLFKPDQIFIMANGNSPQPLDNTEEICKTFGVNYAWVPVGSKIIAQFVGVTLAKRFKYALLIDDDVHLPSNMALATKRIKGRTACLGFSIKSTGPDGSRGTLIQQAQDIEYKMAGLTRQFQARYGSALFAHGAVALWDRSILEKLFWGHPGFKVSEDWYFGHTCRASGYRVEFSTASFIETETPSSLFLSGGLSRGGFGEMTVFKQRYRWNFFQVYRLRDDVFYLLFAWRLGRYELITKLFVFVEIYSILSTLARPLIFPIFMASQPIMSSFVIGVLLAGYVLGVVFFNLFHLRRKNEMVAWKILPIYFLMKFCLAFVNTFSLYYSLYEYASYFSNRHPRVTENFAAISAAQDCCEKANAARTDSSDEDKKSSNTRRVEEV